MTYPVSQGYWRSDDYSRPTSYDQNTVCRAVLALINADASTSRNYSYTAFVVMNSTTINCNFQIGTTSNTQPMYVRLVQNGSCAPGDTLSGSTCTNVPPGPDCTAAATKSQYYGAWVVGKGAVPPDYACIQGCQYPQGSFAAGDGTSYGMSIGMGNGSTCSGANYDTIDTTTKPTDPPSLLSCAQQGKNYGTVNGVGICAAAGTLPNSTVTQNSSSTSTSTSASGVQGTPQTTSDSTSVSNVGGVPTVTDTKTNPDGSKTVVKQDQASYCQMNPTAQVCKGSTSTASGGADCVTPPSCSGDAIQCMMVSQQWHTRCDSNQSNSLSDLGTRLVNGNDSVANPASSGNRSVNPISSSLDQTAFLSGNGGLNDKVVMVSGQSITLPFSRLNQYLVWIGHLFVVLSLIGGLRIVLGGFKK